MTSSSASIPAGERPVVVGHRRDELPMALASHLDRPYRAEQIFHAVHAEGARSFDEMTVLPKRLRGQLERECEVGLPAVAAEHRSRDGTTKYLFELSDGASIEAVDIPDGDRRTLCLSSQAGCPLGCRFCVTGYWGAGRDLTAGEIVGQVLAITGGLDRQQSLNLVYMGMGEPMLNLDAVRVSIEILTEWISFRRVTVSTVGVVPGVEAMASWPTRPNLAISLHAPDDERRSEIMPINRSYPIDRLMASLRSYPLERGRKLTFEYILIAGFNDRPEDAVSLADLLRGLPAKVNLIPVNPDEVLGPDMVPPTSEVIDRFRRGLLERGVFASTRKRRGDDVSAACGQLRSFGRNPRGFRRSNLSL